MATLDVLPSNAGASGSRPSMYELVRRHRQSRGKRTIDERALIRDLLFILQGIDGTYIRFKQPAKVFPYRTRRMGEIATSDEPPAADGIRFCLPDGQEEGSIDATTRDLCHRTSESGWLYRTIMTCLAKEPAGTVQQALHSALKEEMVGYFRMIAVLEARLDLPLSQEGLTLRRLEADVEEYRLRLRMMSTLISEADRDLRGGALLTRLYERTSNGDPFIRTFCSRLLQTLCVPFLKTLSLWIHEGELQDPFQEFFVSLNPDVALPAPSREEGVIDDIRAENEREDKAAVLWKEKFLWRGEMLPGFLEESFGKKIFSTGKSLNFLKYSCQDVSWVSSKSAQSHELDYSSFPSLSASIQSAYSVASQRLFDVFLQKFSLLEHLKALKSYLLLGKGDFVESLMDNLGPSLNRPANTLYRHNLTSTLETALRSSVPAPSEDVLRRLDARMADTGAGELGWNVFTLEYKISSPLDTVIDDEAMDAYAKVFKHLWHVKRVEKTLEGAWNRLMSVKRWSRDPSLAFELHQTRLALSSMLFFVRQIEAYCHLEVIECSWIPLAEFLDKKEGDLDALILEHKKYLDRIVSKTLLQGGKRRKEGRESLLEQLKAAWKAMLKFSDAVDALCNFAISEAARADDTAKGLTASRSVALKSNSSEALQGIISRLTEQSTDFKTLAASMVSNLGAAPDLDMRFLAVRLNFNYAFVNPNKPE